MLDGIAVIGLESAYRSITPDVRGENLWHLTSCFIASDCEHKIVSEAGLSGVRGKP